MPHASQRACARGRCGGRGRSGCGSSCSTARAAGACRDPSRSSPGRSRFVHRGAARCAGRECRRRRRRASFQMTPSTTFAVLRPTPGSFTSSSIVRGTSPPCRSTSARASPTRLFDFCRKNPSVATYGSTSTGLRLRERLRVGVAREQLRRRLVDVHVGGLRAEHGRADQLERVRVVELAVCVRMHRVQPVEGLDRRRHLPLRRHLLAYAHCGRLRGANHLAASLLVVFALFFFAFAALRRSFGTPPRSVQLPFVGGRRAFRHVAGAAAVAFAAVAFAASVTRLRITSSREAARSALPPSSAGSPRGARSRRCARRPRRS